MAFGDDDFLSIGQGDMAGNFSQGAANTNLQTGQQIPNPSLQQMSQGQFQMTANGPQWLSVAPGVQAPAGGGGGSNSDQFFAGANAPQQPRVASVQNNPNNPQMAQYQAMMRQLMGAQSASSGQLNDQYQQMLQTLTGKGGYTDQLAAATQNYGAGQQAMLQQNQQKQTGQLNQDLTSRGLGNTTIRNSALSGLNRDQQIAQQNLAGNIAQQKMSSIPAMANIQQGAFNANPAQGQQSQYLNLISKLGSAR